MKKIVLILSATAFALCLSGCGTQKRAVSQTSGEKDSATVAVDPKSAAMTLKDTVMTPPPSADEFYWNGHINFGISLLSAMLKNASSGENVVVSPLSAGTALSMLAEGAMGSTREELEKAFNYTSYFAYDNKPSDDYIISSANSIWMKNGSDVREGYRKILKDVYSAGIYERDFTSRATVDEINKWCSDNTSGRIPEIVDAIGDDMVMFILNALYFKAPWEYQFDTEQTYPEVFHSPSGDTSTEFMHMSEEFAFGQAKGCKYVILPYKSNDYYMIVALPEPGTDYRQLVSSLSAEDLKKAVNDADFGKVVLSMPKFKVETTAVLNGALKSMGLRSIFSPDADFSIMTPSKVQVDEVKQKCFLEVNEEGAEAAAVTSIGVRLTSMAPSREFVMKVDRPFLFAICNTETNDILFAGRISNIQK